ncbi:MAG: hypothetical protein WA991_03810 [Ornithinimicrobium sp.]
MAIRSIMVSDLTGAEGDEQDFVTLTVRSHPAADEAKALDVLPSEIEGLTQADDLVSLEIGDNGDKRQMVVSLADFREFCDDKKVQAARGTRGRRPGWSPRS